ncbi:MGMT family protein [Schaalia sp. ZJ405]|uniref:MGMT family protein n=1 Tax=Schaalia sp. ZJ405 TaxID=2709403 RepID=UPI002F2B547F
MKKTDVGVARAKEAPPSAQEIRTELILRLVEQIPPGKAATYGQIARIVGTGARVVGRVMVQWGESVPWWRVVNVHGKFPKNLRSGARSHWVDEGMMMLGDGEQIDLNRCQVDDELLESNCQKIREILRKEADENGCQVFQ